MEHRGVEFSVVRTIPKGWVWSVKRGNRDARGTSYDREEAIRKAKRFIENYLRSLKRTENR
jgi:hypothetical protein